MKTFKGTKGRWVKVKTVGDNYNIEVNRDIIANVSGETNAKLMSKAPELLKALQDLYDECQILHKLMPMRYKNDYTRFSGRMIRAEKAINQAL